MRTNPIGALALAGVLACSSGRASGQDVAFLVAEPAGAAPGAGVAVHIERAGRDPGAPAERQAWPEGRAEYLFIRTDGEQENRHRVKADGPGGDSVGFVLPQGGVAMVGLNLAPVVAAMDGAQFEAFRRDRTGVAGPGGLAAPSARPGPPVRVRRVESMASIVRVVEPGGEPTPSATASAKEGLRVEVRALMDPGALRAGSDLPVRVYVHGRGVEGAKVIATHIASGREEAVTADSSGIAAVHLGETGSWRVEFHHAAVCMGEEAAGADWNLFSSSLTFEVVRPAEGEPAKEAE